MLVCSAAAAVALTTAGSVPSGAQPQATQSLSGADYHAVLQDPNDDAAFQRFLDKVPTITTGKEVKRTYYVVEGDLRVTRDELRARLRNYLRSQEPQTAAEAALPKGHSSGELYVMTKDGVPTKWPVGQRVLTYAIDHNSFTPERYALIKDKMPRAIRDWVEACECGLSITHRPEFDADPNLDQVTFIVTYTPNEPKYIALAFFPADPKDQRYLQIMEPFFNPGPYDQVGILRHEIGHILGYRHSHISGVPGCELWQEPGNPNWVALSSYYSQSAMHYPCGGGGSTTFILSERDKSDHRKFYAQ
jgi:hypothetical protein